MIPRYSMPEMAALFSDEARFGLWLEVELLAVEAWATLGVIEVGDAAACRARAPRTDSAFVEAVLEREKVTDHDVAAFVDVVQEAVGQPEGSWIHHGLTSSDVVDTALCATVTKAADLILEALDDMIEVLRRRAIEHAATATVGRTHGMHAEPTTFGVKLALACLQADRDRERLRRARKGIAVGKLSGAVGTYSNIDPAVEAFVCGALGLQPVPATQVIARDRHAEYLYACAAIGTTIESLATEFRHLQRTEVGEVEEAFAAGQKGSSAMPHKRNPITAERLCGLARVLRGYHLAGLEDVALWHERDISHSSVERVVLPDASLAAYYCVKRMTRLVDGLVVNAERMAENLLDLSHGLVFSQPVLLALVRSGLSRDAAYRVVQRDARQAHESRTALRDVLEKDTEVCDALGDRLADVLDEAFDLRRAIAHSSRTIQALGSVSGPARARGHSGIGDPT
ncbi:MAG: adenylosuccinate lyase [Acidimicrobiales bacterium]